MDDRRYFVTYTLSAHMAGLTKKELGKSGDIGACDKIVVHSIIQGDDGSTRTLLASLDGRTNEPITSDEMFNQWVLMAKHLTDVLPIGGGRYELTKAVFDAAREAAMLARGSKS